MKSYKQISLCLGILCCIGLFFTEVTIVHGEEVPPKHGATMKSKSTVSFEEDNSPTNPLDPINPDDTNPVVPTDPDDHEDGTAGPLSIDYISNIRFGMNKASGKKQIYFAKLDTVTTGDGTNQDVPNFVQVTDKRGVWDGWHLTVTQEEQFFNTTAKESLDGAEIKLSNGLSKSNDGGDEPTVNNPIVLVPGKENAIDVASADKGKGSGTWNIRFGNDASQGEQSISLEVPAKTTKAQGEYATTLTWKLIDSPV
ncbi:TPA: WxL domain-containing protein [Listeria innocua]|nr:WxL domain-containing protein [Listeria innocua]